MLEFPTKTITVKIEAISKEEITLTELTHVHRLKCAENETFDTPTNALINAGLKKEDIDKLGESVFNRLYNEVIKLTFGEKKDEILKDKEEVKKNLEN